MYSAVQRQQKPGVLILQHSAVLVDACKHSGGHSGVPDRSSESQREGDGEGKRWGERMREHPLDRPPLGVHVLHPPKIQQ
eukprot:COSAG05_NODE_5093_length_1264_cov_10.391416_1_plen_79_part_10